MMTWLPLDNDVAWRHGDDVTCMMVVMITTKYDDDDDDIDDGDNSED